MTVRTVVAPTAGRRHWPLFGAAGLAATAVYAADLSPLIGVIAFAALGLGVVGACATGFRTLDARPRPGRLLLAATAVCLVAGIGVRLWPGGRFESLTGDLAVLPGYLLIAALATGLLRSREDVEQYAVLD